MNRVQLIGVSVLPIELWHDHTTGRTIGEAMIAVPSDVEGFNFIPVILRDSEAEDAAKYLGEGSKVEIIAHLNSELVTECDAHGESHRRRVLRVIADEVTYLMLCQPRSGDRP
jgi:single-stranded DNA-binding protein